MASCFVSFITGSEKTAIIRGPESWTYNRLLAEVDLLAAGLAAAGIQAGDRVALHIATGPEIVLCYLACFRLGAIAAPLNLRIKTPELEDMLRRLKPSLYIGDAAHYPLVKPIGTDVLPTDARFVIGDPVDATARPWSSLSSSMLASGTLARDILASLDAPDPTAPTILLASSGTTGRPKLIAHSQATIREAAIRIGMFDMRAGDRIVLFLPMVHASGFFISMAGLLKGATLVMPEAANPGAILDSIQAERCSWMGAMPTGYLPLIEEQRRHPRDVSSLRFCVSGGDVCLPGQQEAFPSLFNTPLRSAWASTEGFGALTYGLNPGPVSRLSIRTEIRLADAAGNTVARGEPGEMLLRGPSIALGYWQGPGLWDAFPDGWYATGDIMREDESGHLRFISRSRDLIIRAGSNISPAEVENILGSHPAVQDAGVIGLPDPVLGQRVIAFVQLKDDAEEAGQLDEIQRSISTRLADYKLPEQIFVVKEIPRNTLGKIDRAALAKQAR